MADDGVQTMGRKHGLTIDYVTWEDCARDKGSFWGYASFSSFFIVEFIFAQHTC